MHISKAVLPAQSNASLRRKLALLNQAESTLLPWSLVWLSYLPEQVPKIDVESSSGEQPTNVQVDNYTFFIIFL